MNPSALSPTYTRWMEEAVGRIFPSEPVATCGDCVMCHAPTTGLSRAFLPEIKCCTYWPDLPNFLVGRTLLAGGEGADRLREQIRQRIGLTPFGLQSSPRYHRRYEQFPGKFGADPAMRCPYYEQGNCTIWLHRNGVCQTYFCRSNDGVPGQNLWKQLAMLLSLIEEKLSVDCATRRLSHASFYQDAFQPNGRRNLVSARNFPGWIEEDGTVSPELHARLWGEWAGRETEFFEACAGDVEGCSWEEVLRRAGPDAGVQAQRLRALAAMQVPERLRLARPGLELEVEEVEEGVAYTSVQGSFDVQVLSIERWNALVEGRREDGLLPPGFLPPPEAEQFWKSGLLLEGRPTDPRPLTPQDRLRVPLGLPIQEQIRFGEDRTATVELHVGATELSFDEADLLSFGRTLYARRLGFVAEEAADWCGRPWERTAELLGSLLELGVLERM